MAVVAPVCTFYVASKDSEEFSALFLEENLAINVETTKEMSSFTLPRWFGRKKKKPNSPAGVFTNSQEKAALNLLASSAAGGSPPPSLLRQQRLNTQWDKRQIIGSFYFS